MKLKMKLLAAAVALASANGAFAAIAPSGTGNGELFLSVYDAALSRSYVRDLGITMDSFLSGGAVAPVDSAAGNSVDFAFNPSATPSIGAGNVMTAGYKLTFGQDALLTSFLGTNGLLSSSAVWNIGAMDSVSPYRIMTTVATGTAATLISNTTNNQLKGYKAQGDVYLGGVNLLGTQTSANGSSTAVPADGAAYFPAGAYGANWGGTSAFSTTGNVGQSLSFYMLNTVGTGTNTKVGVTPYSNAQWNLSTDGTLVYAPVPEADTWAMFGVGLLAIGAAVRRSGRQPKIFKELA
jgi:hypothetical protein